MAAFTTLIPLGKSTTSRPSSLPATNSTPFAEYASAPTIASFRREISGVKADTTATRRVSSSSSCAAAGRCTAKYSTEIAAKVSESLAGRCERIPVSPISAVYTAILD